MTINTSDYKGCSISISETRLADSGKRLWGISGRYSKPAAQRPFITSRNDARAWINEQLRADDA